MATPRDATYVAADQFTVEENQESRYPVGTSVEAYQGVDGIDVSHVEAVEYRTGTDDTLVTLEDEILTANLTGVLHGASSPESLPIHTHPEIPAAAMSQAEVDSLANLPIPNTSTQVGYLLRVTDVPEAPWELFNLMGAANKLLGMNADGDDFEAKTISGTTNQATVTHGVGTITISTPQNTHTAATPTFAGLTLTGLTGIVVANGASPCGVVATTDQHKVLRRGDGVYEFGLLTTDNIDPNAGIVEDQLDLDYGDGAFYSIADIGDAFALHANNTDNPHEVSAADVGNDTAQWNADRVQGIDHDATNPAEGKVWMVDSEGNMVLATPPGAGGGEANTLVAYGGGVSPVKGKSGVELQIKTFDDTQFEEDADLISLKAGVAGGCGALWVPPGMTWKDADEIYLENGIYYPAGIRKFPSGHYENPGATTEWEITTRPAIDIDATYSAGATSGMIDAAKVISSWYALYMTSAGIVLALPYIRIDVIAFADGKTTINPASQADGTTAENGFFTANDAWNGLRLQKISYDSYAGMLFTIEDCVTGTPDQIIIDADQTTYLAETDWLQVCPAAATGCVYLGSFLIGSDGNLSYVKYSGATATRYAKDFAMTKALVADSVNLNIYLGAPPVAKRIAGSCNILEPTSCRGIYAHFIIGTSGAGILRSFEETGDSATTNRRIGQNFECSLWAIGILRQHAAYVNTSGAETACSAGATCTIYINEWKE